MISHLRLARWGHLGPFRAHSLPLALRRQGLKLRAIPPAAWFGLFFVALLLAFAVALLFQPTVGRGGR